MYSYLFITAAIFACQQWVAVAKNAMSKLSDSKLNVHIIPHSHDDPGWLKTVDQYYSGMNSSIYNANVRHIFNTVMEELLKNEDRSYSLCEVSFFQRWWQEQTLLMKESVRALFKRGQLAFLNGGWVMHDEAASHYVSMIDQTTLGHRFILDELDYRPRVGWQIDPFGHSKTHAWLSNEVGFDALYFGRIDYQDRALRMQNKQLEFVWKGSKADPNAQVFTGAFSSGNYGPPSEFCIDTTGCISDPVEADPKLSSYNLDFKVEKMIEGILNEQAVSAGNHIMLKMGTDFCYSNAQSWFNSLDIIIDEVNKRDQRFNLFYSDPVTYTQARAAEQLTWTSKDDDFFPYADAAHDYWTGYFTSRPSFKYFERYASSFLQTLRQLSSLNYNVLDVAAVKESLFKLTAAVGLVNHHDAITGTSKQHVVEDYKKILATAVSMAEETAGSLLTKFSFAQDSAEKFQVCRFVNETSCSITQNLAAGDRLLVLVYNPLARTETQAVSVLLSDVAQNSKLGVTVFSLDSADSKMKVQFDGLNGKFLSSEILPTLATQSQQAKNKLVFTSEPTPALGYTRYLIHILDRSTAAKSNDVIFAKKTEVMTTQTIDHDVIVKNGIVTLTFDKNSGLLKTMSRDDISQSMDISNDFKYYKGFGPLAEGFKPFYDPRNPVMQKNELHAAMMTESVSLQCSGAYIFRPSEANEKPTRTCDSGDDSCVVSLAVVRGEQMIEVHQTFSSWVTQIVRLYANSALVEFEYTVGPVPIDDHVGKEVISQFTTSLSTGPQGANKVYTDSNGREFLERIYNYRPTWDVSIEEPIAGNYYPITAAMYIVDEDKNLQVSLLTDRSLAGASLKSGQMEMMVHRRLVWDDSRGVGEPLNETTGGITHYPTWKRIGDGVTATGKFQVLLSTKTDAMKELRTSMDRMYAPMTSFYAPVKAANFIMKQPSSMLGAELPSNVHLLTLERLSPNELLVRLAHQFDVDEDATLSQPTTVDLQALLQKYNPTSFTELTLSANQNKAEQLQNKIQWQSQAKKNAKNGAVAKEVSRSLRAQDNGWQVTVNPLQIRTFSVKLN